MAENLLPLLLFLSNLKLLVLFNHLHSAYAELLLSPLAPLEEVLVPLKGTAVDACTVLRHRALLLLKSDGAVFSKKATVINDRMAPDLRNGLCEILGGTEPFKLGLDVDRCRNHRRG